MTDEADEFMYEEISEYIRQFLLWPTPLRFFRIIHLLSEYKKVWEESND